MVAFPLQSHALSYDFLVGSIELSNDYVIVSRNNEGKNMFSIVASKNIAETNVSTVITTMVYDYTRRHSVQITEDNAEEYLLKYITDALVAHKKSLNITKTTSVRKTKVNDNLGLSTLYFAKTSADTDAVGIITVTYSQNNIVAFIVFQSGSLEMKSILSEINKFESYIPN